MPASPPSIFTPPSGSSPSSPPAVFTPVGGGGGPEAPVAVFTPVGGGGSPSAPPEIFDPEPTFTANYLETAFAGTNNDLRFTQTNPAVIPSIRWTMSSAPFGEATRVVVTGTVVRINLATFAGANYTTAADVKAMIEASAEALELVSVAFKSGNDGTGAICQPSSTNITSGPTALSGGDAITAPVSIFTPITGGGSPDAPPAVFSPITGEGSPDSPPEVFTPAVAGGSPDAPGAVFTPTLGGGSPDLPPMIFAVEETALLDGMQTLTDGGEPLIDP